MQSLHFYKDHNDKIWKLADCNWNLVNGVVQYYIYNKIWIYIFKLSNCETYNLLHAKRLQIKVCIKSVISLNTLSFTHNYFIYRINDDPLIIKKDKFEKSNNGIECQVGVLVKGSMTKGSILKSSMILGRFIVDSILKAKIQ